MTSPNFPKWPPYPESHYRPTCDDSDCETQDKLEQIRELVWPDDTDAFKKHPFGNGVYEPWLGGGETPNKIWCRSCTAYADHPRNIQHYDHCGIGKIVAVLEDV
jgi:hypothetical protein